MLPRPAALAAAALAILVAGTAQAQKPARQAALARQTGGRALQLIAGAPTANLEANRAYCGLTDAGHVCIDVTSSPVLGGALWPLGTPDQYGYNSGIQIAGIIPANAGFAWASDTVGAWAYDSRGPGEHMRSVTGLYDSRLASDLDAWPPAAYLRDTSLYAPQFIGAKTASLQDTWVRYWDGDTTRLIGRSHPMGVMVEQRSLAFDHPSGNEDIVYLIFRVTNITARTATSYQQLAAQGYSAQDIADIAALGADFQRLSEARFGIQIPDAGYTIANAFIAFAADLDVGDATNNYATAVLPFAMSLNYKADFREGSWRFPADVFHAPFAAAPGFAGIRLLRMPAGAPFGVVATYTGCSSPNTCYPDPIDVFQGYRFLKGSNGFSTGDAASCAFPQRHLCNSVQAPSDARFMESAGPFSLAPGQSVQFAVAYVFAAPLSSNPGRPSFDLDAYIGNTTLAPGVPPAADRLVRGLDTLRVIDAALGWVSHADGNASGAIDASEVVTVRGSLLHKAQVAQAMLDLRFPQPAAPDAPEFFLLPGSNRVTVVWQPSATEAAGDPYFAIAADATSPLYDPNYRRRDVEGYRVWRGTSPDQLALLAQLDYAGTVMADYTGDLYNGDYHDQNGEYRCAPDIGITGSCPAAFTGSGSGPHHDVPLAAQGFAFPGVVQIPAGGRRRVADTPAQFARGALIITRADTAVTGGGSGMPPLLDTRVPFVFTDSTVRNGVRYYYAVTAFDVNSLRSGPSSLESPLALKGITPRVSSGQETAGILGAPEMVRANGTVVPAIATPTIDSVTGIFSGPMPPTDVSLGFVNFVAQLAPASGSLDLFVDSILAGDPLGSGAAGEYRMRLLTGAGTDSLRIPFSIGVFSANSGTPDFRFDAPFDATGVDSSQAARFGAGAGFVLPGRLSFAVPGTFRLTMQGRGDATGDPSRSAINGPRWWSGAPNENTANPNGGNCAPSNGACGPPPNPNRTAGALAGVTTLMNIQSYNTVPNVPMRNLEGITAYFYRAADFRVYWGSGVVDSVVDVTHGVKVPFSPQLYASWGILNTAAFGASQPAGQDGNRALLTWADIFCVAPAATMLAAGNCVPGAGETSPLLSRTAELGQMHANGSAFNGAQTLTATGTGFIFYLNGKFFIMQMAALPAPGTVWNARFYTGTVRTSTQTGGTYSWIPSARPPAVPGLHLRVQYQGSAFDPMVSVDSTMQRIHPVPDPFYGWSVQGDPASRQEIRFVNVPSRSILRIYSSSGILVALLTNNDPTGGGEIVWNVRSRNDRQVASGIYFYHVETPDGRRKVGRLTVVRN